MWFLLQGAIILAIAGPIIEWVGEDYKRPAVKLGCRERSFTGARGELARGEGVTHGALRPPRVMPSTAAAANLARVDAWGLQRYGYR